MSFANRDYDPAETSKIRVAASDLRAKLDVYYDGHRSHDAIEITVRPGTYVPEIRDRRVSIAISVLENWNPRRDHEYLCATLSEEIAHRRAPTPAPGRCRPCWPGVARE